MGAGVGAGWNGVKAVTYDDQQRVEVECPAPAQSGHDVRSDCRLDRLDTKGSTPSFESSLSRKQACRRWLQWRCYTWESDQIPPLRALTVDRSSSCSQPAKMPTCRQWHRELQHDHLLETDGGGHRVCGRLNDGMLWS